MRTADLPPHLFSYIKVNHFLIWSNIRLSFFIMTIYILEGGLGNLLFQLNYYFACQEHLKLVGRDDDQIKLGIIDGFTRNLYFKFSRANANRDINIFSRLTGVSPTTVLNSSALVGLGLSKFTNSGSFGFFHDNYSQLSIQSSLMYKCVFTYGQNIVPISHGLIKRLRNALIYSEHAKHIRLNMNTQAYDAVLHFRVGDIKGLSNQIPGYFFDLSKHLNKVLVITNDIGKARSIFTASKFCFATEQQSLIVDLMYMVNAKIFIGSPSTLSWWASEVSTDDQLIHFPSYSCIGRIFNPSSNKTRIFQGVG